MNDIEKLAELFRAFPGIGPRQASRFVYYLLRQPTDTRRELVRRIEALGTRTHQCDQCFRFFEGATPTCALCADPSRDGRRMLIVEKDADLDAIERSHSYHGRYMILGGTRVLASDKPPVHEPAVIKRLLVSMKDKVLDEIILALSATPDGEYTMQKLRDTLAESAHAQDVTITTLGRGLSTGSELEYADAETLKNALTNRK